VASLEWALQLVAVLVLLAGYAVAAVMDWRTREVTDLLWQGMAAAGAVLGAVAIYPDGTLALGLWLVLVAFVFEHLLPWDAALERWNESLPGLIEIAVYVVVAAGFAYVAFVDGVGPSGLPAQVLAAFVTVVFARGLFEVGLLYGGADAKGMIAAGILVPILSSALVPLPSAATTILSIYPFALTMLMNAALAAIAIPVGIAVRNLRAGEFTLSKGFTGYTIPVRELPKRFVWLKDPTFQRLGDDAEEAETSDDDQRIRERQAAELQAQGVERVWVTPQIPFLVLFLAGAVLAVLVGNVLIDLLGLL
jgi:preflagellin peptidase FlaK